MLTMAIVALAWTEGPARGQQVPAFRAGIDLVNIGVTVTDRRGNLVGNLTAEDFEVLEDGKKQIVTYFASGDHADSAGGELHLGLLLDVSESMGDDIAFTKTAAIRFLNTLTSAVDITVVDFDTEVRVGRYSQREFARLVERIRLQKARGSTALYDAIGVYLEDASAERGRKIMLLYTDGGDTRSSLRFRELQDLLKASDVTVYVIGELDHESSATRGEQRLILQQIAGATGGQAFFPTSARELDTFYAKVLAEIRAQYTLGYQSTNERSDGAWRKVEIRIARKDGRDYRPRSRQGYYALFKKSP